MDGFLIQCIILVLGIIACIVLFVSLKSEMDLYRKRTTSDVDELRERLDDAQRRARKTIQIEAAAPTSETGLVPVQRQSFNMNRRVQALKLLGRGEDTAHVAASLGVPRQEVELLKRVRELTPETGRPAKDETLP